MDDVYTTKKVNYYVDLISFLPFLLGLLFTAMRTKGKINWYQFFTCHTTFLNCHWLSTTRTKLVLS